MRHSRCNGNATRRLCCYECDWCWKKSCASSKNFEFWSSENLKTPREVFRFSETKYLFDCPCGHTFDASPANVEKGKWCPYCSNPPRKLCTKESCDLCVTNSFESSEITSWWSDENGKRPREVFKNSHVKYKFVCQKETCGHKFEAALNKITSGTRCPYCCKGGRKICKDESCVICKTNSFNMSHRMRYWSSKNKGTPRDYTKSTTKKFLFDCPDCGHEFSTALGKIAYYDRWCPYCAVPSKKLCDNCIPGPKGCKFCYDRTFAGINTIAVVKKWSKKNALKPWEMSAYSHKKCIFDCEEHGEFTMALYSITEGRWCGLCKRKTEAKLFSLLTEKYPGKVKREAKFDWSRNRKTNRHLPFDFCLEEEKIIIELDGAQHFRQVYNWAPPDETRTRDRYKERKANESGYSVIRLLQEEVLYETSDDWRTLLEKSIERVRLVPDVACIEYSKEYIVSYEVEFVFNDLP